MPKLLVAPFIADVIKSGINLNPSLLLVEQQLLLFSKYKKSVQLYPPPPTGLK